MTKYFRKPVPVEAWQVVDLRSEQTQRMPPKWVIQLMLTDSLTASGGEGTLCLQLPKQLVRYAGVGDWLVLPEEGNVIVVYAKDFAENYEAYPEPTND